MPATHISEYKNFGSFRTIYDSYGNGMCVRASNMRKWRSLLVQVETDESSKLGGASCKPVNPSVDTRILHSRKGYLEITTHEELKRESE